MSYRLAEMYHLSRLRWQFFGTLTFREAYIRRQEHGKGEYLRFTKFLTWGRELSAKMDYSAKNWERRNVNVLRLEPGEIGGLWHYHFLMAGLDERQVNRNTCWAMQSLWRYGSAAGGFPVIRVFDDAQNGEEYITKCLDPRDTYEFNKFGLVAHLKFSPACVRLLRATAGDRRKGRFAVQEKSTLGLAA